MYYPHKDGPGGCLFVGVFGARTSKYLHQSLADHSLQHLVRHYNTNL